MKKKLTILTILLIGMGIFMGPPVQAYELSSSVYRIEVSQFDNGGIQSNTAANKAVFHSTGAIWGVSSANSHLMVSGIHFSSKVLTIAGYDSPYDTAAIPLTSVLNSTITTKLEYSTTRNNTTKSVIGTDTSPVGGWGLNWDSYNEIPLTNTASVVLSARAFDGLTWGPIKSIAGIGAGFFYVDNEWPVINTYFDSVDPFSPNNDSSVGLKDTSNITFTYFDSFPHVWAINIKSSIGNIVRTYTTTENILSITRTWDGKDNTGSYVDDGLYTYEISVTDKVAHNNLKSGTLLVDNISPNLFGQSLTATGLALNSQQGSLSAIWSANDNHDTQLNFDIYYAGNPYPNQNNPYNFTGADLTNGSSTSWSKNTVADSTYYMVKVVARDDADNIKIVTTNIAFAPDRTAPNYTIGFNDSVSGIEDVNWSANITSYKTDNISTGTGLIWEVYEYPESGSTLAKSTRTLLNNLTITNGTNDFLNFSLKPDYNTETFPGNRYGKSDVYFKLTLYDAEGNYKYKDIALNIANVNDPPYLTNMIGDGSSGVNYHFYTNENAVAGIILLDNFVDDIDHLKSSLTWVVSANSYISTTIGNSASGHKLTITPSQYWYGDTIVTINVVDGSAIPINSYAYQQTKIRVWPVNYTPVISADLAKNYTINEDNQLVLNLRSYQSDAYMEDSLDDLQWTVQSYNNVLVQNISGERNPADQITFTPYTNKYGTTNIVLRLADLDTRPKTVFPDYVPNPKYTEVTLTATWNPVNDVPVIGTIAAQRKTEDDPAWYLNLADIKSDIEDAPSALSWAVNSAKSNFLNISVVGDEIKFTPVAEAWGTSNVTFSLTDTDSNNIINFPGYSPNPRTTTRQVLFTLLAVNDAPRLGNVSLAGTDAFLSGKIKTQDTLTVAANGYSDIGYASGTRADADVGDEYNLASITELNYTKNEKLFNYKWYLNGILYKETYNSTKNVDQIEVTPNMEGKNISLEVYPGDGITVGSIITTNIQVNNRPALVSAITPDNAYYVTENITVSWNYSTDKDADNIKYRVKVWKETATSQIPTIPDLILASYWDSGWRTGYTQINPTDFSFTPGEYYWSVFASNEFSANGYDYKNPTWKQKLTVQDKLPEMGDLIGSSEIIENPKDVQLSGKFQIIYGHKPANTSIWLDYVNEHYEGNELIMESSYKEIIPINTFTEWAYQIEYPEGKTTYNFYIKDSAENKSSAYDFVITEDNTPPIAPDLSISNLQKSNYVWQALTSQNYYVVQGYKENGSSIWFNDGNRKVQVVPYSTEDIFSFKMYSQKPTGYLTSYDRAGNESAAVTVNIRFILGEPMLTIINRSRDIVNSDPDVSGLTTEFKNELAQTKVEWLSNRKIKSYNFIKGNDTEIISGGAVEASTNIITNINANLLDDGDNTITLQVFDEAGNIGKVSFPLTLQETSPAIVIKTYMFQINGSVYMIGERQSNEIIYINGNSEVVNYSAIKNEWWYQTNLFDFKTTDLVISARDSVYNESVLTKWDHNNYASLSTAGSLTQIIEPGHTLPPNVLSLLSLKLTKISGNQFGLKTAENENLFSGKTNRADIYISSDLLDGIYYIYGKGFDQTNMLDIDLKGYDVQIHFPYSDTIRIDVPKLVIVQFNQTTGLWEYPELNSSIDEDKKLVSAILPKTGIWGLAEYRPFLANLNSVRIYPNPWRPNDGIDDTGDATGIYFDQLAQNSTIKIYTVSGQLVIVGEPAGAQWIWNGKNESGRDVVSGVYLYTIQAGSDIKKGKITVIR